MVMLPMAAGALRSAQHGGRYLFLSAVGSYALLPLLFTPAEYPIKVRWRGCSRAPGCDSYLGMPLLFCCVCGVVCVCLGGGGRPQPVWLIKMPTFSSYFSRTHLPTYPQLLVWSLHTAAAHWLLSSLLLPRGASPANTAAGSPQLLPRAEVAYLWGLLPLELYCSVLHSAALGRQLPFLPLMLTSVYCALGVAWAWLQLAAAQLRP